MGSCSALHSKMMLFCSIEKYCDVKIRVQDKCFPCHRVVLASASEYFDALFGGSFAEKDAPETVLHDIDVETFMEIRRYVYTAKMCEITASNALNLLSASLFLRIHSLEEACAKYILENVSSVQNHIRILVLARPFNIPALINGITEHVIQNFRSFYNDETLLEMSFDDLSFLLDRWSKSKLPFKYEDLLLHSVICWVYHASEERREYFIKVISAVDFERISPNCVTFMMQHYKDFIDQPGLEGMPPLNLPPVMDESKSTSAVPVGKRHDDDDNEDPKKRLSLKRKLSEYFTGKQKLSATCDEELPAPFHDPTFYKDVLGLHIYAEYISIECPDITRRRSEGVKVLSSNEYYPDWFISCETDAWRSCTERRTVVQESTNLLYCLEIFQDGNNYADSRQAFCTYSSIDLKLASSVLTSPPVHLEKDNFNICATSENDIYLFKFGMKYSNRESLANDQFSVEELRRGFYRYNCEVDKWFPAPKMRAPQDSPRICADHNLIYSIGGNPSGYGCRTFQAFDHRTGQWITLPRCISESYGHVFSNSCVLQNNVFVSNRPSSIQVYDTVAGKWKLICPGAEYGMGSKMVSYSNKLWYLYIFNKDYEDYHALAAYSPNTQEWYHYEGFDNVIRRSTPKRTDGNFIYKRTIKDMITFKTCSL